MAKTPKPITAVDTQGNEVTLTPTQELVQALVQAISLTRPVEKKTFNTRIPKSPWDPKDGSKKLKLTRKMYQHGITIDPDYCDNETIDALNRIKVGRYINDYVKVYKRKDQGIDIDYPVKTASQRMRLLSAGVTSLKDLCLRCIAEHKAPKIEIDDAE